MLKYQQENDKLMNWINNMYILTSVLKYLLTKCWFQSIDTLGGIVNCYVLLTTLSNLFCLMKIFIFTAKQLKFTPNIQLESIWHSFRQVIDYEPATFRYLYQE